MILCLDCGNTRIKWGLRATDGTGWAATGAVATAEGAEFVHALPEVPGRIIACNVAGGPVQAALEAALHQDIRWIRPAPAQCGVRNGYANPMQLGADRWAALIGAHHLQPGAALVVCAGTATTIDLMDEGGVFRGGLILPGLALMHRALSGNTAGLQGPEGTYAEIPDNTADAISAGAIHATLGAIERMMDHLPAGSPLLLTGGAAPQLAPHWLGPVNHQPLLILEGLARIAAEPDKLP